MFHHRWNRLWQFIVCPCHNYDQVCLHLKFSISWQATWHKGHSLAQTVFSCIYLLRPDRTSSHALLHSLCRVMRATCKAVVSVVSDARTHEVKYSNSSFTFIFYRNKFKVYLSLFDKYFLNSYWIWTWIYFFRLQRFHRRNREILWYGSHIKSIIWRDVALFTCFLSHSLCQKVPF